jgi:hypothetical protein
MSKRSGQDNLRDILILAYQGYNEKIIKQQKQVIEFLRQNKGKATRTEIEKLLGMEFSKLPEGTKRNTIKRNFYRRISPLLDCCIDSDREEKIYTLSGIAFHKWFESIRRTGKETFGGFE